MSQPIRQKVEVGFAKRGRVRFISHHDLMRVWQRACARAGLPLRYTEGYNPRPRIVFPDAVELGVESDGEVAEIELVEWLRPSQIEHRLKGVLPEGIRVKHVKLLAPTRRAQQAVGMEYLAEIDVDDGALHGWRARLGESAGFVEAVERTGGGCS